MRFAVIGVGLALMACGGSSGGTAKGGDGTTSVPPDGGSVPEACRTGSEACKCYGNGTCDGALQCASNLCVNLAREGGVEMGSGGAANPGGGGGGVAGVGGKTLARPGTGGKVGSGGASNSGGAPASGGVGGAGQCLPEGAFCSVSDDKCCLGQNCVFDTNDPGKATCATLCRTASECSTGCCAPVAGTNTSVCVGAIYCAATCGGLGTSCLADIDICCANTECAYDDASNTTASCATICTRDRDCVSGCCAPLTGTSVSLCSSPAFCESACLPAGTRPCGLGTPCCGGTYCVSDAINQICLPTCTLNSDCDSGCCTVPNGNGVHVCTDSSTCH